MKNYNFKWGGNSFLFKFYSKLNTWASKKAKKYESKTIEVISIKFPSPFLMLIRFSIINKKEKYELTLQGKFTNEYKLFNDSETISDNINPEEIIKQNFKFSYKITP
jgi:hypothetical protein